MPFSALLFLSAFLPAFLVAYWASPRAFRNGVTLLFSVVFYAWGAPRLLPVILGLGILDYYLGNAIARTRAQGADAPSIREAARYGKRARVLLILGITTHLSVLAYFKYSNFLVAQVNAIGAFLPASGQIAWKEVPLPIGISFLTFEEISYLVDVYRGHARPARSVGRYLLFLMLFPHSIAGPIFRWKDLEAQIEERSHSLELFVDGIGRFVRGLGKKVLVADALALAADRVFAAPPGSATTQMAWTAAFAYTMQIYFDFSGYSDMAIGLGKMTGFLFKENFDQPYRSSSITEFWKRWHISLSTWLRDYLYVSLGGNRSGERRTRLNVFLVFALSGLWHGAAWTFVIWGMYHGLLVIAERTVPVRRVKAALPLFVNVGVTLLLVVIGWVFFRAPSIESALGLLGSMFRLGEHGGAERALYWAQILPRRSAVVLGAAFAISVGWPFIAERKGGISPVHTRTIGLALVPVVLALVLAQLVNSGFAPLIYFKF